MPRIEACEDPRMRAAVFDFAATTLKRQRIDWLELRRRAREAPDPLDRHNAREAVKDRPPPSWDQCLAMSRRIHIKREIDHRDTL